MRAHRAAHKFGYSVPRVLLFQDGTYPSALPSVGMLASARRAPLGAVHGNTPPSTRLDDIRKPSSSKPLPKKSVPISAPRRLVSIFGKTGVLSRHRGPAPPEISIFGEAGVLETERGETPIAEAADEAFGEMGVFEASRGTTPAAHRSEGRVAAAKLAKRAAKLAKREKKRLKAEKKARKYAKMTALPEGNLWVSGVHDVWIEPEDLARVSCPESSAARHRLGAAAGEPLPALSAAASPLGAVAPRAKWMRSKVGSVGFLVRRKKSSADAAGAEGKTRHTPRPPSAAPPQHEPMTPFWEERAEALRLEMRTPAADPAPQSPVAAAGTAVCSTQIPHAPEAEPAADEIAPEIAPAEIEPEIEPLSEARARGMKVAELREALAARGLDKRGLKAELIERLVSHLADKEVIGEPPKAAKPVVAAPDAPKTAPADVPAVSERAKRALRRG